MEDTQDLADFLASSGDFATDLATLIATNTGGVTEADLVAAVESDPILAVQLPAVITASDIQGNYYVVADNTMLYFVDASNLTLGEYNDITTGGIAATWSFDATASAMTINFTDTEGSHVVVATTLGGTANAVLMNILEDGVDHGIVTMRRMEPVGTGSNIALSDIEGGIFVDFQNSGAMKFASTCNGSTLDGWIASQEGTVPAVYSASLGMLIVSPDWAAVSLPDRGDIVLGLLSDAWDSNTGTLRQASSFVAWQLDEIGNDETTYSRGYIPIDPSGTFCLTCVNAQPIALRIDVNGEASLRLLRTEMAMTDPAEIVIYNDGAVPPAREKYVWTAQDIGWPATVNLSSNNLDGSGGPVVIANLGNHAGRNLNAVFAVNNINTPNALIDLTTRAQYNLREIAAIDVEGKTFAFSDIVDGDSGTIQFVASGTGTVIDSGGTFPFNWSIAADATTNASWGGVAEKAYTTLVVDLGGGETLTMYRSEDLGDGSFIIAFHEIDDMGNIAVSGAFVTPQ